MQSIPHRKTPLVLSLLLFPKGGNSSIEVLWFSAVPFCMISGGLATITDDVLLFVVLSLNWNPQLIFRD